MKLIEFYGIEIDRKDIYDEKKIKKTNWLGVYIGDEIVRGDGIKETIIYRRKYIIPADKINMLVEEKTQNSNKWLINDIAVEQNEFEKVIKQLKEI